MALDRETHPGSSRMHAYIREFDWSASSFGEPASWARSLCAVVDMLLDSAFPMCLSWGPELRLIYNDAYLPLIGHKHPAAFGAPMQEVFAELWPQIGPIVHRTVEGESCYFENFPAEIIRYGRPRLGWFTFSYTPVRDDSGTIAGFISVATETTKHVELERRHAFQLRLSDYLRRLSDPDEIIGVASRMLGEHLKLARVGYLEIDRTETKVKVRNDWSQGELAPLGGYALLLDKFGPKAVEVLIAGRTLKVDDTRSDERTAAYAPAHASTGALALLAVPLIKNGRLRAVLRVHRTTAHLWTDDEVMLVEDVAERTWDAVERAHSDERRRLAEEELQHNAALQAFRLELSDMLRPLSDPDAIIAAASSLLGHQLGASRVLYAEVDEATGTFDIRRDWTDAGVASVAGRISRLDEFGAEVVAALRAGSVVAVEDIAKDERTVPYAEAYARVGVHAFLGLPLVKSGRLSIVLLVQQEEPCRWRAVDLQRAQDMAERTWSHVETARAQAALRAERDQSQYVFDSMTEGFAMLDPDCRLLQMNAEGLRISQLSAPEVIGRKAWEIWPKVVGSGLADLYHRVMQTGKGASVEYRRIGSDDEPSWLEVRAYPALNGGLAVFYRDINERKQAEEKLKEADRRKDEFLAMLAHELRNPLAPIAAAAELLSIEGLNPEDVKHTSEVISRQVSHMTSLVNDLLDMSRVTSGLVTLVRAPMDLKAIMAEAIEQVEPLIRARDHHLAVLPASMPALVWGDHKRLVQVLANLLNNAAKYTPPGGNIVLQVEALEGFVCLTVRDDGIGMSPELVKSAFELFTQAHRASDRGEGGLGIGLALVRGIVELHGGTVTAHSDGVGLGSDFRVMLPRAGELAAPVDKPGQSLAAHAGAELKVLIVDDNVDAAKMLGMLLKIAGQRVFVEHQPKHALELARAAQPDVCLLDIGLPEMDGNELARRLRALPETSRAVLVAVTGYSQAKGDRNGAVAPEFDHHMVKPIDTGRLLALLRHIGTH